jgi:hypothetical protein
LVACRHKAACPATLQEIPLRTGCTAAWMRLSNRKHSRARAGHLSDRLACHDRGRADDQRFLWHPDSHVLRRPPSAAFHVRYGEHKARFAIASGDLIEGELPVRAQRMVREWAAMHREELEENWRRCEQRLPLTHVEPLA